MERVRALTDQLEAGITGLFQSGQYAAYLQSLSKLHHYSYGNIFLIKLQCPHASMVAGYGDWKRKFGRHVKAGETGITILAPCPYWARDEVEETGPDGQTIKEQKWVKKTGFTTATVFDVSQTEGRELPSLGVESLTGTVEGYEKLLSTLKSISPVPVSEGPLPPGVHGAYYHAEQKITLSPGMSEAQTIKTLVHEIAHATFHQRDRGPCDQCGLCAAGQPLPGTEELPGPRPGTGGRSAKKSRPPRSARTLLTTAREWLDSQADEEYGYEDDGDY